MLLESLPQRGRGERVLDVGCGDGHLAAAFANRGFRVTGVERPGGYSDPFPSSVQLIEADLEHGLPVLEQKFEYIVCGDVLEHMRRPEDLLGQLRDALAPGGVLVASLPNSGNIYFRLNVLAGRFPQEDKGLFDRTHLRFYMWAGWRDLLARCGFRIVRVCPTGIPVGLGVPRFADSLPVRLAERVCYGLAHMRMTLFAYQFVVRAEPVERNAR